MRQKSRRHRRAGPGGETGQSRKHRLLNGAALALAAATALAAGFMTFSMIRPESGPAVLAITHESRADAALGRQPPDFDAAIVENRRALNEAPLNSAAWMRAAYLRQMQTGALDAAALADIRKSYEVAPLGPDITRWRVRYLFENWTALDADLRQKALTEFGLYARNWRRGQSLVEEVQNPSGRMAATLALRKARTEARVRRRAAEAEAQTAGQTGAQTGAQTAN